MMILSRRLVPVMLAAVLVSVPTLAGAQPAGVTVRIRGDITSIEGQELHVTSRRGEAYTLHLANDVQVQSIVQTAIDAIKPGSFVGSAAVGQPDGTLRALEVHVFPESMRGTGEGFRPFDLGPGSTMTNGTVGDVVVAKGRTLTVSYKGGQKTIVVPPQTPVVTFAPGDKSMLVPKAHVIVFASQGADKRLTAERIAVGKNGLVPPM